MQPILAWLLENKLKLAGYLLGAFAFANQQWPMVDPATLATVTAIAALLGIHVASSAHAVAGENKQQLDSAHQRLAWLEAVNRRSAN